jgi:serpin B
MFFRSLLFSSLLINTLFADSAPPQKSQVKAPPPAAEAVSTSAIAESANTFGFELMKPLGYTQANMIFSPLSIFSCLSLAASGAEGTTKQLMEKALHWPSDRASVAQALQTLTNQMFVPSKNESCSLVLTNANALFAEQDTNFLQPFMDLAQNDYQANLQSIDFSHSVNATELINTWVAETTNNKIKRLVELGDIDAATRLVLINAIYFSGQWQTPFDKKETAKKSFAVDEKTMTNVQMMHQISSFQYLEDPSVQVVILPFANCEATNVRPSLIIALPNTSSNLASLQKKLSNKLIQNWLKQSISSRVDLQIPQFCLLKRYDLQSTLTLLGMRQIFTDEADFSGIDGMKDLFLSKALHESFFHVNEDGVEAAAATAAALNLTSIGPSEKPPLVFNANRPFLFFLVDEISGTLLFMGKFSDPSLAGCE